MRNPAGRISLVALTTLLIVVSAAAQERSITFKEYSPYIETSREVTKDVSFRTSTRVLTGDSPTGRNWAPYSSWVEEFVYPDRSHMAYKTPMQREFVRIGKYLYSRTDPNSKWELNEDKGWANYPNNPAGRFGFPPWSEFSLVSSDGKAATIRVVAKRSVDADEKHTDIVVFVFDSKGILIQKEEIGYNGWSFVRRIEDYEYDSNIKVEAPIQ